MPIVRIEMVEGKSVEQKRELVDAITREMVRITGCSQAGVYVVIEDVKKDNWAIGGTLVSDRQARQSS